MHPSKQPIHTYRALRKRVEDANIVKVQSRHFVGNRVDKEGTCAGVVGVVGVDIGNIVAVGVSIEGSEDDVGVAADHIGEHGLARREVELLARCVRGRNVLHDVGFLALAADIGQLGVQPVEHLRTSTAGHSAIYGKLIGVEEEHAVQADDDQARLHFVGEVTTLLPFRLVVQTKAKGSPNLSQVSNDRVERRLHLSIVEFIILRNRSGTNRQNSTLCFTNFAPLNLRFRMWV